MKIKWMTSLFRRKKIKVIQLGYWNNKEAMEETLNEVLKFGDKLIAVSWMHNSFVDEDGRVITTQTRSWHAVIETRRY